MRRYMQAKQGLQKMGHTVGRVARRASQGRLLHTHTGTGSQSMSPRRFEDEDLPQLRGFFSMKPPELEAMRVVVSTFNFLVLVALGVLFYHLYPGEEKTVFNAVYMSVITLSTVGFGVVTPQTEAGKVFGAFWML